MTDFCIQIHPERSADLDVAAVETLCEGLARDQGLIQRFAVVEGADDGNYVNLMFETQEPRQLWGLLQEQLYQSREFGGALQVSSMVMCEGSDGWNDYLLLHHYDPAVARNDFPPG
jgi:hypothetical protein